MKFLSYNYQNESSYGVKVKKEEAAWDLKKLFKKFSSYQPNTLLEGIQATEYTFLEEVRKIVELAQADDNPNQYKVYLKDIEWLAPIPKPTKNILCAGHNYESHVKELGDQLATTPKDVIIFTKSPTTLVGDNATVPSHKEVTSQFDYEGELAIVISKPAKNILRPLALDYIFGYTILNDLTARDIQKKHNQFFLGKSLDQSAPMGPYLVTKDEVASPEAMTLVTKVNGEVRQNSATNDMLFRIDDLIVEISKIMTLEPGDIIATGTPAGVGSAMNPPQFLKTGDEIKVSITSIGTLTTKIGE